MDYNSQTTNRTRLTSEDSEEEEDNIELDGPPTTWNVLKALRRGISRRKPLAKILKKEEERNSVAEAITCCSRSITLRNGEEKVEDPLLLAYNTSTRSSSSRFSLLPTKIKNDDANNNKLNFIDLLAIGVGGTIGSGVFVLTGK